MLEVKKGGQAGTEEQPSSTPYSIIPLDPDHLQVVADHCIRQAFDVSPKGAFGRGMTPDKRVHDIERFIKTHQVSDSRFFLLSWTGVVDVAWPKIAPEFDERGPVSLDGKSLKLETGAIIGRKFQILAGWLGNKYSHEALVVIGARPLDGAGKWSPLAVAT